MKFFRCTVCAAEYEAVAPGCACGATAAVELVPVHYLVPADGPIPTGIGPRMVACNPKLAKLPKAASGERLAVTCPRCKASDIFKEDERDGIDNHDPRVVDGLLAQANQPPTG